MDDGSRAERNSGSSRGDAAAATWFDSWGDSRSDAAAMTWTFHGAGSDRTTAASVTRTQALDSAAAVTWTFRAYPSRGNLVRTHHVEIWLRASAENVAQATAAPGEETQADARH